MNKEELKKRVDKIIEGISSDANTYIKYWGEDDSRFIYEIAIGRSNITFNYKTGEFIIYMCHSNYNEMYKPFKTKDTKELKEKAHNLICKALKEYKYDNRFFLERIAKEIEKRTGMKWEYIGEDNDSLTIDFDCNISYMKNLGGKGLQFTLDLGGDKGVKCIVENDEKLFITKVENEFKRVFNTKDGRYTKTTPNKEILVKANDLVKNKQSGTIRLYEDNCWWADVEYFANGNCRFWVGYEDKRTGNSNGSLFTIYDLLNKRYSCEFKVKVNVKEKIFSVAKALYKSGLYV